MRMKSECVICILNQIKRIAEYSELDPFLKKKAFKSVEALSKTMDHSEYLPPLYSELIYDEFFEVAGLEDPYEKLRKEQNDLILGRVNLFRELIIKSSDPLFTALHFSLIGNVIDYGGVKLFDFEEVFKKEALSTPHLNGFSLLKREFSEEMSLLIIADNAGEAVFDMLFLEQVKLKYPGSKLYYGVKSGPAINDVMKKDAIYIGVDKYAEIIETGSTYAGTVIPGCNPEFVDIFNKSDIVISKGQGNFETLEMVESRKIFFVFKVKCEVVSNYTGLKKNSMVMTFNDQLI